MRQKESEMMGEKEISKWRKVLERGDRETLKGCQTTRMGEGGEITH